jgi:hypothetical protein
MENKIDNNKTKTTVIKLVNITLINHYIEREHGGQEERREGRKEGGKEGGREGGKAW